LKIDLKQQTEKQKAEQEHAERIKEIEYQLNSDFLTERPGAALRTDNPQRFIRYGFKGFSPEQQQAILQQQQQQVQDAKVWVVLPRARGVVCDQCPHVPSALRAIHSSDSSVLRTKRLRQLRRRRRRVCSL